ncbi:alpha-L-rhamnosidase [Paenibacillus sp. PAMC21692]|uniref:alpha-L-rhamnosidase n=1 Tax=Paenibacillus sp. PAMC21692 TaxID=2762320 RepID=UPI00164E78BF|nr:alpha-L-rhamnosidase [Paenibacillus sp. PAMC21692]QNK56353.1 family 78 glycoside hydrolase catalytic domain [Paenibacillus sp. PAMC21692]
MALIHHLHVDGQDSPTGIDVTDLQISWQLDYARGEAQPVAAQLLLATRRDLLSPGQTDIWDSGMMTGRLTDCRYGGPELQDCTRYWWKVLARDVKGDVIASEPATFLTGLNDAEAWRAQWIWKPGELQINDFAYFRKDIELRGPIRQALLFASAHHAMRLFIDGSRIGGYGSPAPTNPEQRKLYTAYEVTSSLRPGKVCLAAIAHYLGGGGQNYVDGLPGFRLQLEVIYEDGSSETFGTDESWQIVQEIPHACGTPYQQNRRVSAIEDYDARKLDPAWNRTNFAAEACQQAVPSGIPAHRWPMKRQRLQEGAEAELIVPTLVKQALTPGDDGAPETLRQVFDAGQILSGWPRITLSGISGATIRLRYSEDLDEHGFVKHHVSNETSHHYYDQYTMRGDELEIWQPDFSYKAFRYIEVTGYPETIRPGEQLSLVLAYTGMAELGSFDSSDELLNKLYAACIRTQKNNVLGQIVDCPHREQAQYLADSDLQAETLLYNFDARAALEKVLTDFAGGQLDDGTFPFVYPTNYDKPDFKLQIPEWDLHFCSLLWKLYMHTGDDRLIVRYYDTARRMVDYYLGIRDTNSGLVPLDKGWHISDWPYPSVDHGSNSLEQENSSAPFAVQNMKLHLGVDVLSRMAGLIGRDWDAAHYDAEARLLREAIVESLYDSAARRFRSGLGTGQIHQGINALALHLGLAPAGDAADIVDYIANSPWESRTVLSLPLLRALFENGQGEAAYRLISKESYPGWGYMISQGAPTMWEGWDDIESHCHAWNGYPARMLQEYVVGIRSMAPGFAEAEIAPFMPEGLSHASAAISTPLGALSAGWERGTQESPNEYRLTLHVPTAMKAKLVLPMFKPDGSSNAVLLESEQTLWANGTACGLTTGVRGIEYVNGCLEVQIESGTYDFVMKGV